MGAAITWERFTLRVAAMLEQAVAIPPLSTLRS